MKSKFSNLKQKWLNLIVNGGSSPIVIVGTTAVKVGCKKHGNSYQKLGLCYSKCSDFACNNTQEEDSFERQKEV